jgi:hypothetical protein
MSERRDAELVTVSPRRISAEPLKLPSLDRLLELDADVRRLQRQAEEEGKPRTALLAVAQGIKIAEAVARLNGDEAAIRARVVRETPGGKVRDATLVPRNPRKRPTYERTDQSGHGAGGVGLQGPAVVEPGETIPTNDPAIRPPAENVAPVVASGRGSMIVVNMMSLDAGYIVVTSIATCEPSLAVHAVPVEELAPVSKLTT